MFSGEDGPRDGDFGDVVKETLERWHVPGISVAVVDGAKTWTKVPLFYPHFFSVLHPI